MKLYNFFRSGTSHRLRIALNLKGLTTDYVAVDLRKEAHLTDAFKAIHPQGFVPALDTGEQVLIQSPAILEWLEERYPDPALLPERLADRAVVRAMSSLVACDVQPINNVRVLAQLRAQFGADAVAEQAWIARWITVGLIALEPQIRRYGRGFAFGEHPTLADCHLAPQIYSAQRFNVELSPFPACLGVWDALCALPAFEAAHPDRQPDAPR
jgi:maleylpyruvate isomerase